MKPLVLLGQEEHVVDCPNSFHVVRALVRHKGLLAFESLIAGWAFEAVLALVDRADVAPHGLREFEALVALWAREVLLGAVPLVVSQVSCKVCRSGEGLVALGTVPLGACVEALSSAET